MAENKNHSKSKKNTALKESIEIIDDLNNDALITEIFWTKTQFHIILFRTQYPCLHPESQDGMKSKKRLKIEEIEDKINLLIDQAVDLKILDRSKTKIKVNFWESEKFFVFKHEEYGYPPKGLLRLLQRKQYPVPMDLLAFIEKEDWGRAAQVLPNLAYNMNALAEGKEVYVGTPEEEDPKKGSPEIKEGIPKVKPKKNNRGRPPFPYSDRFVNEVKKLHKIGVAKKELPFRESITKLLNPDASNLGRAIDKNKYKEAYKHSLRTVKDYIAKALR